MFIFILILLNFVPYAGLYVICFCGSLNSPTSFALNLKKEERGSAFSPFYCSDDDDFYYYYYYYRIYNKILNHDWFSACICNIVGTGSRSFRYKVISIQVVSIQVEVDSLHM